MKDADGSRPKHRDDRAKGEGRRGKRGIMDRPDGYSPLSIVLHWLAAIFVVAVFLTHDGERGSAAYVIHVSGGAVAGVFLLWRVWHRVRRGMIALPDQAFLLNAGARVVQWGFLVAILVAVITGYLLPWSQGNPLDVFGVAIPSPMASSREFHQLMEEVHDLSGHLFIPLLALHILGTAKHAVFDKSGIARRMFKATGGGR